MRALHIHHQTGGSGFSLAVSSGLFLGASRPPGVLVCISIVASFALFLRSLLIKAKGAGWNIRWKHSFQFYSYKAHRIWNVRRAFAEKCTRNHSPCSFAPCRSKRKVPARISGGSVLSCFTHKALSNLECSKRGCRNAKGSVPGTYKRTYRYHRNIHSTNPSIRRHVLLTKTIQKDLRTSCNRKPKTRKNEDRSLCTHGGCRQCLYSLFHEHEKSSATIGTRRLFGSG